MSRTGHVCSCVALIAGLLLIVRPAMAQRAPVSAGTVTGVVVDVTGAVLPDALVELKGANGATVKTVATDGTGAFRIDGVAQGRYDVLVTFAGFRPTSVRLTMGARAPNPLRVTMPLAAVTQEVNVSNGETEVSTDSASNVDAVSIDTNMLESLPVFDNDYIGTISRFLDTGSLGTNGVTLVVNGMEVSALTVSASAVQQIKINQDPYSAAYSRPGRGRIEILTKPGGRDYHGDASVTFRDATFNASDFFATTKPPEQRRIFEGFLGGPVGHNGKTSFMFSADDDAEDQQAFVVAEGLAGTRRDQVAQPNRRSLATFSITHQVSDKTTISVRPNYEYESHLSRGVGGTTLASAGTNFQHREEQVTYTQQSIIRPTLINQFQMLFGHEREPTTSVTPDRGIVVSGAFTGGGAQGDLLRTETHINLNESLSWTRGAHLVQGGFQLPDWSRRGFYDRTNFGGTYYFSGLDTYAAGQPYAFIQQHGNGDVVLLEKQVGTYIKDDWSVRPGLTLSAGLRYDWQNYFHDNNNVAPRLSFAYAPGDKKTNVIRGGVGRFNDRSGPVVIADILHSQPGGLTKFVISNPSYPNPFQGGAGAVSQPPSIVRLSPDVQIPYTWQYSLGIDHQLQKTTTLSVTYTGAHGFHLFRSRDINAPLPPLYLARPNPAYGVVREIESDGRQQTDSLQVTLRGRVTKWFNGQMQYTLSRAYNDTNGITAYAANDYDRSGEYARADFDRRHRFLILGRITAVKIVDFGGGLSMNSAGPYTEMLGGDPYNNGRGRARPVGVPRNSLEGSGYVDVDLRASRDVKFAKGTPQERTITIGVDAFNLFNRVNYGTYVGTLGSSLFGQPVSARPPRQLQFSLRLKF
jgi:hypothetical protein